MSPSTDIEVDPSTGLPLLPEGYFFRVAKYRFGESNLEVHLRKKTRFGSTMLYSRDTVGLTPELTLKQTITQLAERIYRLYREDLEIEALIGDYPPKRLT